MTTNAEEWLAWMERHGEHGFLRIDTPELLPPGLEEALGFGRFSVVFREGLDRTVAVQQSGSDVEVRVSAGLLSEENPVEAGTIQRIIRTGGKAVHEKFFLPTNYWGGGNARSMLRAAVRLYDELEIQTVSLTAVSLGKYIWAAAGFDFADDQTREAVNVGMRLFANELGIADDLPDFDRAWDVLALDYDDQGNPVYVANQRLIRALEGREDVDVAGAARMGDLVPSKALLLYGRYDSWDGVLDLTTGSDSRNQLEMFLGTSNPL